MALSDDIKTAYDQIEAMIFAAEALQKCMADPSVYNKPYHGSESKEKVLQMQLSLNTAIKDLYMQVNALYELRALNEAKKNVEDN